MRIKEDVNFEYDKESNENKLEIVGKKANMSLGNLISIFTLIGMSFGAGVSVGNTITEIQDNDRFLKLHCQMLDLKEKNIEKVRGYEAKMSDLCKEYEDEIYELRIEIYSLRERLLNKKN